MALAIQAYHVKGIAHKNLHFNNVFYDASTENYKLGPCSPSPHDYKDLIPYPIMKQELLVDLFQLGISFRKLLWPFD